MMQMRRGRLQLAAVPWLERWRRCCCRRLFLLWQKARQLLRENQPAPAVLRVGPGPAQVLHLLIRFTSLDQQATSCSWQRWPGREISWADCRQPARLAAPLENAACAPAHMIVSYRQPVPCCFRRRNSSHLALSGDAGLRCCTPHPMIQRSVGRSAGVAVAATHCPQHKKQPEKAAFIWLRAARWHGRALQSCVTRPVSTRTVADHMETCSHSQCPGSRQLAAAVKKYIQRT